jgi:hypothetical protein
LPAGAGDVCFDANFRQALPPKQSSFEMVTEALFLVVKWRERGAEYAPPSGAKVKNEYGYTSIPPYACPGRRVGLSAGVFPSNFVLTIFYAFLFLYSCCVRSHSYRPDKYLRRDEVTNLIITHFSPVTSALSDPKLLPSTSSPLLSVQACVCLFVAYSPSNRRGRG